MNSIEGPRDCCLDQAGQEIVQPFADGAMRRCRGCGRSYLAGELYFEAMCVTPIRFQFWKEWSSPPAAGSDLAALVQANKPYFARTRESEDYHRVD